MEEDQQFCLRWNNHQSTLISVFDTLLENGTLVDCTLAAEGKFLKAHKVVLSACSPYFATLLSQQYDKHPIFILKDVKFQELRAMMDYMYRGEVNISQDQLGALLKAAESLQIKGLSDNRTNTTQKNDTKQQVPVSKSGLTIEQKRPLKHPAIDIDSDMAVSREGSTSPTSRKRKKFRRRSTEGNSITDNHDHSNSSSQSLPHVASTSGSVNNLNTSVVNVTKKTEILQQQIDIKSGLEQHVLDDNDENNEDEEEEEEMLTSEKQETEILSEKDKTMDNTHSELMIEPKNEYDDSETVEDLTLEDEELLEDLDQAGPSHAGEGSSQGYAQWQVERSQDEVFMASQEATGQHRDAQALTASTKTTSSSTTTTTTTASSESSEPNKIEPENKRVMRNSLRKTTKTLLNDKMTKEKETSINSFKNLNTFHPRIKYSKHKNPSIHQQQQQQQQQSSKTTSSSSISSSSVVSSIITTTSNTTDINQQTKINLKQHQQQQQHFHELEITSGASSNADNDEDDLHSSIMTDLANYAEIDDIELPDGSKIGFGDTDEFTNDGVDEQKYSSASLDDDYKLMSTTSSSSMKYEYLSDSAVSATDELGRHYICRHCGKRYRWKSTLRRHENVECGGKQPMHQCPHCTYKAKQRGNLGVHIRKHHTAMPPLESRRKLNLNRSN